MHKGVSLGRDRTSAQPQLAQEAAQHPRGLFLNPEALSSPAISSSPPARPGGWPGRSSPALPAQPPAQGGRGAACPRPPGSCGQDPPTRAGEGCRSTGRGHPSLCPLQTLRLRQNNLVTFKESPKAYQSPADVTRSWPPCSQPTANGGRRGALPSHEAPAAPGQQAQSPSVCPGALQGEGTHPQPAAGPVPPLLLPRG